MHTLWRQPVLFLALFVAFFLALLWPLSLLAAPTFGVYQAPAPSHQNLDSLVVAFKPGVSSREQGALHARLGAQVVAQGAAQRWLVVKAVGTQPLTQLLKLYQTSPLVRYAEPNRLAHAFYQPNDPLFSYQWHFANSLNDGIGLPAAWDVNPGGASHVIVAVLDTGVAYENYGRRIKQAPDLQQTSFVAGWDFIDNDSHPNDENSHGTHVAGTIAQSTDNGLGVAGIAFNCQIMPVRVLDRNGSGSHAAIANGIYYAVDHGADVINMSLGGPASITMEEAVAYAYQHGVTVVAAAGNDGVTSAPNYPAAYDAYVIAVAASRLDLQVADYSSRGSYVDITAPGGDLNVDQNGDGYPDGVLQQTIDPNTKKTDSFGYWFFQGTSMATPHVAGAAALLISQGASSNDEVRQLLQSTALDIDVAGVDVASGYGLIQVDQALLALGSNVNQLPQALFSYQCSDLSCQFDGSGSTDADGTLVSYQWDFGDGSSGVGANVSHDFAATGNYVVSLTVTDDQGASGSFNQVLQFGVNNEAQLSATVSKQKGYATVHLTWSGLAATEVVILRDAVVLQQLTNQGSYDDAISTRGGGSYNYQVCDLSQSQCSNVVNVVF